MKRLLSVLLLLPGLAFAHGGADDVKKSIEASMVVTGWVEIAPDGSVPGYSLDQQDKLPQSVVDIVHKTIDTWKFQPIVIGGKPVLAKARMNLRVVASPLGGDRYELHVRGATFGGCPADVTCANGDTADQQVNYKDRKPPSYPMTALQHRTGGTVYLAVEVDRQGHAENIVARQVDLRAIGTEREMRELRNDLAGVSIDAARQWTFTVPHSGPLADQDHWTVMIPVNFSIRYPGQPRAEPAYGQWQAYVPGPVQPIPWEQDERTASSESADALPEGSLLAEDPRFVLLTPLTPG